MALFDRIIELGRSGKITSAEEVKLINSASEGENMAASEELAKVFAEHNSEKPNSDAKDQCQCEKCKAYREAK